MEWKKYIFMSFKQILLNVVSFQQWEIDKKVFGDFSMGIRWRIY